MTYIEDGPYGTLALGHQDLLIMGFWLSFEASSRLRGLRFGFAATL